MSGDGSCLTKQFNKKEETRGPFLESPDNFLYPESYFTNVRDVCILML